MDQELRDYILAKAMSRTGKEMVQDVDFCVDVLSSVAGDNCAGKNKTPKDERSNGLRMLMFEFERSKA